MNSIAVIFGAGADRQIGLSGGDNFAKAVVGLGCPELTKALKDYFDSRKLDEFYPHIREIRRDDEWTSRKLLDASVRKELLLDNGYRTKREFDDIVQERVDSLEKDEIEKLNQLAEFPSYMGLIDGDFHTLINPSVLGAGRFWRVVLFYSRAYYYLIHEMDRSVSYKELVGDYFKAQRIMDEFSDKICRKERENYYSVLKGKNVRIITTNYTNTCERVSGIDKESISYIHGKFGWFESIKDMRIIDMESEGLDSIPNDDLLFPFIFIQSGVKPIVCVKQLEEYSKMISFLKEASAILVVGYKINSDDNHITSILRQYLNSGKRIIYFDYGNQLGKDGVLKRLRVDESDYLSVIPVGNDNCVGEFKKTINRLT